MKTTTVKDVMTTSVVAVREDADFKEMVTAMRNRRISAFPVIDASGRVIGVVSEADLLLKAAAPGPPEGLIRLAWLLKERTKAAGLTAAEVMTKPAVTVTGDKSICVAAQLMQARRVKRLPVVDENGILRGIVTRSDILAVFERPDEEIADEVIKAIINDEYGLDPELFVVTVRSGVVTVTGSVAKRSDALAMLGAIRHLEGVVGVRDRLSYPPAG
ncbi:MAG TPA: CBS domain-containing protein [Streptosporangiaceae bacterium]|nr:CBS domain-containing protein [Streptosporangiaceae bacterium]